MRWLLWFGLAAVLFLLLLIARAPAQLLPAVLPQEQVVMQGVSGTIWNGRAARVLVNAGHGFVHLGATEWQLSAFSLLRLRPELNLDSRWGGQRLSGRLLLRGESDVELRDAEIRFAARLANEFTPFAVDGPVTANFKRLRVRDGVPVRAAGRVVWEQASWLSPSGPQALGSYAVELAQLRGAPLDARILSLAGPLRAQGTAQLRGRDYTVDVTLQRRGGFDPQLRQTLALLAEPVGGGYRLRLDGTLAESTNTL